MNQQYLQAYVNLIQQLLACPSGEEWILLRQNEALVTPELVQIMEQVATQLTQQGNAKEAKFLHNLAGQIHHLFVAQTVPPLQEDARAQAYLEFIKALLDCPAGSEGKLFAAHPDLLGPGLVRTMQQIAGQLADEGDPEAAQYLQDWSTELSRLWLQQHDFRPTPKPEPEPEPEPGNYPAAVTAARTPQPQAAPASAIPFSPGLSEDLWTDPEPRSVPPPPVVGNGATVAPLFTPAAPAQEPLAAALEAIATTLANLTTALQTRPQPAAHPLWYMEVLEQAQGGGWVLTSEEVQQLIGVKPSCPKGQDSFQRGCWVFVKVGKLGTQTAWRVEKTAA